MENDKRGEEPKMSGNKEEEDEPNEAVDTESEKENIVNSEANAVRRAIRSLDWRHELHSQEILKLISSSKNDERNKREFMSEAAVYQKRFQ